MNQEASSLRLSDIDIGLLKEAPFEFARNNRFLLIKRDDNRLSGLVCDDNGIFALRDIADRLRLEYDYQACPEERLLSLLHQAYSLIPSAETVMGELSGEDLKIFSQSSELPRDLLELRDEAPVIKLLNALFLEAVKERASDIHIEPYERELEVRFRIDGILKRLLTPPKLIQDALISRIKVLADLDIAEKRLPQDGRIRLIAGGRDIDIRVSIIPTFFGERAVLRILDRMKGVMSLEELGLGESRMPRFASVLSRSSGIMLVTGPTGSGKTTTLYGSLLKIYSEQKNIITIEDPVEYQIKGVGQIQVNPKIDLDFAAGLRSVLRQDPDIIMVGEIRDRETAEIAIQASLTGHLVLSTLHTNDSASAVTRLVEMEIEPFLVASSLSGVLAQRLVRKVCNFCKEPVALSEAERSGFPSLTDIDEVYRGRGCPECRGKGYLGRTGIFEFLSVDEEIKDLILAKKDSRSIQQRAVSKGMATLMDDGISKVKKGITTIEEVLRVTNQDYAEL